MNENKGTSDTQAAQILKILAEICEDDSVMTDRKVDLFKENLLDSLSVTELLVELDDQLGIYISPAEIEREQIRTPELLLQFVEARSKR
ncbi:D-alanine--poly(phosphoribitol) ligase subunit 2 [Oscillospiraceae bacterium HV4-5-C5C]|nr:D-alanine--poly(phosphoribitol) ligase subunit 2 [Oscillospiraceae bacterium HV4-5-C5C]